MEKLHIFCFPLVNLKNVRKIAREVTLPVQHNDLSGIYRASLKTQGKVQFLINVNPFLINEYFLLKLLPNIHVY